MARRHEPDLTIIEVLDPDDPSLLWSDAPIPVAAVQHRHTPQRSSGAWPWLLGTAAVLALAWFVASAFGDDPEPPTPPVVLADGRYLLDDPSFEPYSADIVAASPSRQVFRMWTDDGQPGARSVTVEARQGAAQPFVATDAAVRVVDGVTLMVSIADPTVVVSERDLADGWHAVITTRGLELDEAAEVTQRVQVVTLSSQYEVELLPSQVGSIELQPVAGGATLVDRLYGDVTSELRYLDPSGAEYTLRVADGLVDDAARLLQFVSDGLPTNIGGRVVGRLTDTGEGVVLWEDEGTLLSLTAPVDPSVLASSADRVRPATRDEWQALLRGLQPDYRLGEATVVAESDLPGEVWIAGAQRARRGGDELLLWWFSEPGDRSSVVSRPASAMVDGVGVDRFVIDGHTFVFVRVEAALAEAVTVSLGPDSLTILPLQRGYLDESTLMAVTRLDVSGEVTVTLIPRGFAGP